MKQLWEEKPTFGCFTRSRRSLTWCLSMFWHFHISFRALKERWTTTTTINIPCLQLHLYRSNKLFSDPQSPYKTIFFIKNMKQFYFHNMKFVNGTIFNRMGLFLVTGCMIQNQLLNFCTSRRFRWIKQELLHLLDSISIQCGVQVIQTLHSLCSL